MRERGFGLWTWASRRGRPCDGNHLFFCADIDPGGIVCSPVRPRDAPPTAPWRRKENSSNTRGWVNVAKLRLFILKMGKEPPKSPYIYLEWRNTKNCPCIYFEWRVTNPPYIYQFRMTTHKILLNICFNEEPQNSPYIYFEWRTTKNYLKEYSKTI